MVLLSMLPPYGSTCRKTTQKISHSLRNPILVSCASSLKSSALGA